MAEKKETETYNKGKPISIETESYIRNNFLYDELTGQITRKDRKNSNGSFDKDGYLIIKIKKHQFKAHRIAWFLYYGKFPILEIDHINHNRNDNRICNLREVNREQNNRNHQRKPNIKTNVVGVYLDNTTKGLKKKYTTRFCRKTYRFYSLKEAKEFRIKNNLLV